MCFYQLRQIRHLVGPDLTAQLVHAFILSRLDYGNSILVGQPKSTIAPFQRVQNAAARLILHLGPCDHVICALRHLHWLTVHAHVQFKLCTMMHSIHVRQSRVYFANLVHEVAANQQGPGLRSVSTTPNTGYHDVAAHSVSGRSPTPDRLPGTNYRRRFVTSSTGKSSDLRQ